MRTRVVAFGVCAFLFLLGLWRCADWGKGAALARGRVFFGGGNKLAQHDVGDPLLLVAIVSCRTLGCAKQREMLRTSSWPSLLAQRALVTADGQAVDAARIFDPKYPDPTDWRRAVNYVFVVGREMSELHMISSTPESLLDEQQQYNDLIMLDAPDDHAGFTIKMRQLIMWFDDTDPCYARVAEGSVPVCPAGDRVSGVPLFSRYSFFMKTDDDVFLHMPNMVAMLRQQRETLQQIPVQFRGRLISHTLWNGIVIRDPKKRFADPAFPLDKYPPYPWGAGYIFNREGLWPIASVARSPFAPTYVNEDTTIGVWMNMVGLAVIQHIDDERFWNAPGKCADGMILWHQDTPAITKNRDDKIKAVERAHKTFTQNVAAGCSVCWGCPPEMPKK